MREIFKKDVFATQAAGIEIDEVSIGYAKCSMKVTPGHLNAGGKVMGTVDARSAKKEEIGLMMTGTALENKETEEGGSL